MKRENGFTRLPNAVYGLLTGDETLLYAYLLHRQGSNQSSWWSIEKLAESLNFSESKVKRVTKSLVSKGWLSKHRAPSKSGGWGVNHYRALNPIHRSELTPSTGQNEAVIQVTGDLLKRTSKNNQQTKILSASAETSPLVDDEFSILDKPNLDKPQDTDKGASERLSREKPFPEVSELIACLPERIKAQVQVTSTLNDLLAQLMITQNRSMAELKLWLGNPDLWKEARNGGALLTSLLKKQLANGYTPSEPHRGDITPTPPLFNAEEVLSREAVSVPMPDYVRSLRDSLKRPS